MVVDTGTDVVAGDDDVVAACGSCQAGTPYLLRFRRCPLPGARDSLYWGRG